MSDNIMTETATETSAPTDAPTDVTPETDTPAQADPVAPTAEAETTEAPAEAPKRVKRVARKRPTAKPAEDAPAETEAAPKKRGRPAAEPKDPGKLRQSSDLPADIRLASNMPSYSSDTTKVRERLADLRENPIMAGSKVKVSLIFTGDALETWKAETEKRSDYPLNKGNTLMIFLGTDKSGNVDWLVGTKGDKLVRLREDKNGKLTYGNIDLKNAESTYNLGFMFDDLDFEYWTFDPKVTQFNLGKKAQLAADARLAAKREAAKAEAKKTAAKTGKTTTVKPVADGPAKKVRVVNRKTPATAGK